jgi:hypothetical protein
MHEQIGGRIDLSGEPIAAALREGGILDLAEQIPDLKERLTDVLENFSGTYVTERIYEETRRLRKIYEADIEETARTNGFPDVWEDLFPPQSGQVGHDSLRRLYDVLHEFWMQLRADLNKKASEARSDARNQPLVRKKKTAKRGKPKTKKPLKWAPVFKKDYVGTDDGRQETQPDNATARFFLAVARLFDPAYSASNCYSVVDRVKNERRSPKGLAALKERRRQAGRKNRGKARSPEESAH